MKYLPTFKCFATDFKNASSQSSSINDSKNKSGIPCLNNYLNKALSSFRRVIELLFSMYICINSPSCPGVVVLDRPCKHDFMLLHLVCDTSSHIIPHLYRFFFKPHSMPWKIWNWNDMGTDCLMDRQPDWRAIERRVILICLLNLVCRGITTLIELYPNLVLVLTY